MDDATYESVATVPERAIGGDLLTRILNQLHVTRGLPQVRTDYTDNGKEFCGRAMLTWAYEHGATPHLVEPGKPNQSAYIELFNGHLRDECLNERWFMCMTHAKVVIEAWRCEYNQGRPKMKSWWADARCPRITTGCKSGYDGNRALKPTVTQWGGHQPARRGEAPQN